MAAVILALVLLGGTGVSHAADAAAATSKVAVQFEEFCKEWMGKLAARERDNRAQVKWQNGVEGATGEFTGYSPEHTCTLKPLTDPKAVPIGTITYRELRYRQVGSNQAEAAKAEPVVTEITEVVEIFRYTKGKWVY